MTANRMTPMRSIIASHRHTAAVATELRALTMDDDACQASDLAHELHHLNQVRLASSLALAAEEHERQLAA